MSRDILYYENRIAKLESRPKKNNSKIVAKLKREMRNLIEKSK